MYSFFYENLATHFPLLQNFEAVLVFLSLLDKYIRLCHILKTSVIQTYQPPYRENHQKICSKAVRNKNKTKEVLHKTIYVYFHIRKCQSATQNALENVYDTQIANEILWIKSFK